MYAKLFSSLYQGTLRGCADEILVFTNLLAHADSTGVVDKHWRAIADETGISEKRVKAAILHLEAPDSESRSPEMDGRRIIPIDEHRAWGWQIVNFDKYREIKNEDDRREQNRIAQQKWREKQKISNSKQRNAYVSGRKQPVSDSKHPSATVSTVSPTHAHAPSKDILKQREELREEKERKEREAETALPLETEIPFGESPFDNPAVVLYEEKFHVHIGSTFRKEIVSRVQNLQVWTKLLGDNAARGDLPTTERKKISNWILKAYDERMEKIAPLGAPKMTDAEKDALFERQHYDRPLPKILVQ